MKRILFLVNGYGLGNSTRCHAIVSRLRNAEIDVATSRNGWDYFSRVEEIKELIELEPLSYGLKKGKISLAATFWQMPKVLRKYLANVRTIENQLAKKDYDLLVTDSDYSALLLKSKIRCPVISINNADCVLSEAISGREAPLKVLPQLVLEFLDFAYHAYVPNAVISPTLRPRRDFLHFSHVPPIVRPGIRGLRKSKKTKTVVVMTSGSSLGKDLSCLLPAVEGIVYHLVGLTGRDTKHFKYVKKNENNIPYLNQADLLVINGGFSSVSEAYCLRKNALVIPIPNHAEQFFNAKQIQGSGFGLVCREEDLREKIVAALKLKPKHRKPARAGDGARIAAQLIARYSS